MSSIVLSGYLPDTRQRQMTPELAAKIAQYMPQRMQLREEWHLKYSLEQHGASLKTLYERSKSTRQLPQQTGHVLVIRDARNGVFGAYSSAPFQISEGRYRGNGDCFLWKLNADGNLSAYTYKGINDFVLFCTDKFISFGAGDGHYGLWVDDSLAQGVTYRSVTFDNDVLSAQGSKFNVIALEVWEL